MFIFVMFFLSVGIVAWHTGERMRLHDDSMVARAVASRALADDAAVTLTRIVQCEDASRVLGSIPFATGLTRRSPRSVANSQPRYGDGRTEHRLLDPSWVDPWWDDPTELSLHALDPDFPSWVGSYIGMDLVLLSRFRDPNAGDLLLRRVDDYAERRLRYLYRQWDPSTSVAASSTPILAPRWHLSLGTPSNQDLRYFPASGASSAVQADSRFTGSDPYGRSEDSWGTFVPVRSLVDPHRDSPSRCRASVPTLSRYASDPHPIADRRSNIVRPRVRRNVATGIPSEGQRVISAVIADVRPIAPVVSSDDPFGPLSGVSLASQSWVHRVSHSRGVPSPSSIPFSFATSDMRGSTATEHVRFWPSGIHHRADLEDDAAQYHPDESIVVPPSLPSDSLGHSLRALRSVGHVPYVPSVSYTFPLGGTDVAAVRAAFEIVDPSLSALANSSLHSKVWDSLRWHRDAGGSVIVRHVPTAETDTVVIDTGVSHSASRCHLSSPVYSAALCPDAHRPVARVLLARVPGFSLDTAPSEVPIAAARVVDIVDYHGSAVPSVHQIRWVGGFPVLAPAVTIYGDSAAFALRSKTSVLSESSDAPAIVSAALANALPAAPPGIWSSSAHRASHAPPVGSVSLTGERGAAGPVRGFNLAVSGAPCDPSSDSAPVFCRGVIEAP